MTHLRKLGQFLTIFGFFAALAIAVLPTPRASAQSASTTAADFGLTPNSNQQVPLSNSNFTVTWIDAAHIEVNFGGGKKILTFVPGGVKDNGQTSLRDERGSTETGPGVEYHALDYDCDAAITFDINENDGFDANVRKQLTDGTLDIDFRPAAGYECNNSTPEQIGINVANPIRSLEYFVWVDSAQIQTADGQVPGLFVQAGANSNIYVRKSEDGASCQDKLLVDKAANTVYYYELDTSFGGTPPNNLGGANCKYREKNGFPPSNFLMQIGHKDNAAKEAFSGDSSLSDDASSNGDNTPIELNCDASIFNPLSWFMCPLVEGAAHAIQLLDKTITQQLTVEVGPGSNFDENNDEGGTQLYQVWSVSRTMGLSLLAIIVLVMIIAQAISIGPVDPYTIKKVLPRILIAAVAIMFSWQLCKLAIGISNDFGQGVGAIIARPFQGLDNPTIGGVGQGIGAVGAIAGFFSGIDLIVVLSFVVTALAGLLIAFLVIAFRNIMMLLLVISAPLAIIFWILPNTQRAWKLWHTNFLAVLLTFPLIVAIIALGRVFASLTSNSGQTLFTDIIVFIAYFGPYFAMAAVFRLVGGAVATIGGVTNDRSKGFFDKRTKRRQERMGVNHERRGRPILSARANVLSRMESAGSNHNNTKAQRFMARRVMGAVGGYNLEAQVSAKNAQVDKEMEDQIATGNDADIRGLSAMYAMDYAKANGDQAAISAGLMQIDERTGARQYKTLGGAWANEANVLAGKNRWGNDHFAQQKSLSYEMRKAMKDEEIENIDANYNNLANSWGMTGSERAKTWIGASFANQNLHPEFKTMSHTGEFKEDGDAYVNENWEKRGSYPLSQVSAKSIARFTKIHQDDQARIDHIHQTARDQRRGVTEEEQSAINRAQARQAKIKDIASTFVFSGGGQQIGADGETPVYDRRGGTRQAEARSNGSAHLDKEVQELARVTGAVSSAQTVQGPSRQVSDENLAQANDNIPHFDVAGQRAQREAEQQRRQAQQDRQDRPAPAPTPTPAPPPAPQGPPPAGTYRDAQGNLRSQSNPGQGGTILPRDDQRGR